jgi:hypothetical protein
MARIRILQAVGGLDFSWTPGEVVDLDDEEAAKWADGERAELVDPAPDPQDPDEPKTPQTPDGPPGPEQPTDPDGLEDGGRYDPIVHPVKDVLAYLQDVGEEEAMRVLQMETGGEDRKGIAKEREAILQRARARDQAAAEKAAEASRGGGRGDGIETR